MIKFLIYVMVIGFLWDLLKGFLDKWGFMDDISVYTYKSVNYDEYELKRITEDYMLLLEEDIISMYTEDDFIEMIKFGKLPIKKEDLEEISRLLSINDLMNLREPVAKLSVFIFKDLIRRLYVMESISYEDCSLIIKDLYEKSIKVDMGVYKGITSSFYMDYFLNIFKNNEYMKIYKDNYEIRKMFLKAFEGNKKINKDKGNTLSVYYAFLGWKIKDEITKQFEDSEFIFGVKKATDWNIFDSMSLALNGYARKTDIYDKNKQLAQIGRDYYALSDKGLRMFYTMEDFITVMEEGRLPMEPYPYYKDRLSTKGIGFAEGMLANKSIEEQKQLLANYIGYVLHDSRKRDCAMKIITFEEYRIFSDKMYLAGKSRNSSHDDLSNPENLFKYCMEELFKSTDKYRSSQDINIFIGRYLNKLYGDEKKDEKKYKIGCDLKKGLLNEFYEFPEVRKELYVY